MAVASLSVACEVGGRGNGTTGEEAAAEGWAALVATWPSTVGRPRRDGVATVFFWVVGCGGTTEAAWRREDFLAKAAAAAAARALV